MTGGPIQPSYITELRLTRFKSFRDAVLPLEPFTLLVGRNGSGKSNALDALTALSALAGGEEIRDALDGGRDGAAVRGGVLGCAPFGEHEFTLGCTVRTGADEVTLDVRVQTGPTVQVVWEKLRINDRVVLRTDDPHPDLGDIVARWRNQLVGPNPKVSFRASRLLTTQVAARIDGTEAGRTIHRAAGQVLAALQGVFVLDPVPHQMRQYVPRRDSLLRRNAENLSAAVATLIDSPAGKNLIRVALGRLNEQDIGDVDVAASTLDDVMITLREGTNGHEVPARLMSDGSLRFLAVPTALMQTPEQGEAEPASSAEDVVGQRTVVIEELENGLHASQARHLVDLVRDQVRLRRVRALATAHSPALLDALHGDEHRSVVVCQRDAAGHSTLTPLVDLPGYLQVVAGGGLGRAAVEDRLRTPEAPSSASSLIDDLLMGRG